MTKKLKRPNNFVYLGQALGINRNMKTETNRRVSQGQYILPVIDLWVRSRGVAFPFRSQERERELSSRS